ncbi:papain family cysteine protease [Dictyocaulus viviparus]|uniref:Papain family cysteine protease n=1 Tax=Dictyocaulus viviparus TaxID=29172 RepID=A0A0D8XPY8_DICVI|nr:papain family cysteine protease [Dictyocaulus viviparus]
MPRKERREIGAEQSRCGRKHIVVITVIISVIVMALIIVGVLFYMRSVVVQKEWIRTSEEYLHRLVEQVNENVNSTWKDVFRELIDFPNSSLPTHFDARLKWPHCPSISRIPNQGGCGSCYVNRACIHSNGTFKALLSEEDVLGCCDVCGNCYGGDPLKALVYWVNDGIVTGGRDGCRPYSFDRSCGVPCSPTTFFSAEKIRTCIRHCQNIYYQNSYDSDKHYATLAYSMYPRSMMITNDGEIRIQIPTVIGHINETSPYPLNLNEIRTILKKELFIFGPMTMAFPVSEEFLHYSSGIFQPHPEENFESRIVYWHVVRLIGWGEDNNGSHYWIAVNSFGEHWGESGEEQNKRKPKAK